MINLDAYDYNLPKAMIAQYPEERRDFSKLMILNKNQIKHKRFYQIISEIKAGDVIVRNNSKVIASNLKGQKQTGGKVECLFLREIDPTNNLWLCLLKGRKLRSGTKLLFLDGQLQGTVIEWKKFGEFVVQFSSPRTIKEILREHATITLPPYIKVPQPDLSRYQTIYASKEGSVAAPTAGFHFTTELIYKLEKQGIQFVNVTLHVGYSTFMPLTPEILSTHKMDPEFYSIPPQTIEVIEECQSQNHQIIAVGTTTLKTLESATNNKGKITHPEGWSELFIAPGYSFKSGVTRLITNFHMPKSSPLLMVCAFAGRERILRAYREAISQKYRFYSFGDAMLVDKEE